MERSSLDEAHFIREKLGESGSSFQKYRRLTIGNGSVLTLIKYELITCLFGPIPGALGLFLRGIFFPLLFRRCGKKAVFGRNVTIRNAQNITIGDNVFIDDDTVIDGRGAEDSVFSIGNNTLVGRYAMILSKVGPLSIGDNCNVGSYAMIVSQGGVTVQDWVQIAGRVEISGGLFKVSTEEREGYPLDRETKGPIVIGERTYLGSGAIIIDGVKIGKKCQIGAGSVVIEDLKDYSVFVPRPGMLIARIKASETEPPAG